MVRPADSTGPAPGLASAGGAPPACAARVDGGDCPACACPAGPGLIATPALGVPAGAEALLLFLLELQAAVTASKPHSTRTPDLRIRLPLPRPSVAGALPGSVAGCRTSYNEARGAPRSISVDPGAVPRRECHRLRGRGRSRAGGRPARQAQAGHP